MWACTVVAALVSAGVADAVDIGGVATVDWQYNDDTTTFTITMALEGAANWMAIAIGNGARMGDGLDVIHVFVDSDATVTVTDRYSDAQLMPTLDSNNDVTVDSAQVVDNTLTAILTRPNAASGNDDIAIDSTREQYLVWAVQTNSGDLDATNTWYHTARGAFVTVFSSGSASASDVRIAKARAWTRHAWLMGLSMGVFMPVAVLVARFKDVRGLRDRGLWFQIHRTLQTCACVMAVGGIIIAVDMSSGTDIGQRKSHRVLGYTLLSVALLNPLVAVARPHDKGSDQRRKWYMVHAGIGYLVLILTIPQVLMGLHIYGDQNAAIASYWVYLVAVLLAMFYSEVRFRLAAGRKAIV